jgi:hypothetical protein
LILTSFVILGEIPSPAGAAGIFLVATGAFLLTFQSSHGQSACLRTNFLTFFHNPGVRSMLFVAFLYSLSVNYDKEVVVNSSPLFGSAVTLFLLAIIFLLIAQLTRTRHTLTVIDPIRPDPVWSDRITRSPFSLRCGWDDTGCEGIAINTAYTGYRSLRDLDKAAFSSFQCFSVASSFMNNRSGRCPGCRNTIGAVVIGLWG